MRKSILLCIFIYSLQFLNAQPCINSSGFQKIYWNKGIANLSTYKTLQDKSGNIFLAGEVNLKVNSLTHVPYQLSVFVIKTNPNGTVLWEKSYDYYQSNTSFQNINVTNDGGLILILIGGIDITSSIIIKLDSNGNFQWSVAIKNTFLNTAIQLINGDIIAAGCFNDYSANSIFCINEQGILVWSKTFKTDSYNTIPTVTELETGELLVCETAHNSPPQTMPIQQPHQHFFITKLDSKTGNKIWAKFFVSPDSVMLFNNSASSNYLYLRYNLHELPDKSFKLYVGDSQYPFPDANSYYHFDSSGNFLNSKRINSSFNFYYTGTNAQSEDFFYGTDSSIAPILFKISNNAVAWAQQFKSNASFGELGWFNSGAVINNGFLLSGYFITHKFSTTGVENEVQPYLIKTDTLGRTNCSDTFSVPIAIINGSPLFSFNGS